MLVLTRKLGERIMIGDDIVITVKEIRRGQVRIGVEAPRDLLISRSELRADRQLEELEPVSDGAEHPSSPYYRTDDPR